MTDDATSPVAHSKHGDLTLDQIGEMQPGMARLMVEISDRFWIMYYAAKAGGWMLARHEYGELRKTMLMAGTVRPKYQEPLTGYIKEKLKPIEEAMRTQDWPAFDKAFHEAAGAANEMHVEYGYDCIVWQLPDEPPKHLKLTP